jgi:uncharacterized protein
MAKVPVMGRVKTRLAREIGAVEAVRFYRHTLAAVLARLGRDARWQTSISIAPDTGIGSATWPLHLRLQRQGGGDLGQRMQRAMSNGGPGPVIIIGTDIPAITPANIAHAFSVLNGHDAVFGAAPDGGYWLAGLRRCPRILSPFGAVRWSSATTLSDTAANLAGRAVGYTATLPDVDNAAEFKRYQNSFGRRVLPLDRQR